MFPTVEICVYHESSEDVECTEEQFAEAVEPETVWEEHGGQQGRVPVRLPQVGRPALTHVSGRVRKHPVVHVCVLHLGKENNFLKKGKFFEEL